MHNTGSNTGPEEVQQYPDSSYGHADVSVRDSTGCSGTTGCGDGNMRGDTGRASKYFAGSSCSKNGAYVHSALRASCIVCHDHEEG